MRIYTQIRICLFISIFSIAKGFYLDNTTYYLHLGSYMKTY